MREHARDTYMNPSQGHEVPFTLVFKEFVLISCRAGIRGCRLLRNNQRGDGQFVAGLSENNSI